MAIVYLKQPPLYAAAFNPIRVIVQTPQARYAQLEKDLAAAADEAEKAKIRAEMDELEPDNNQNTLDPLTVLVSMGGGLFHKTVIIEREPDAEGKAEVDLSYVMRHAFVNSQSSDGDYSGTDFNLIARYYLVKNGVWGLGYHALNSVKQLGYYDDNEMSGLEPTTRVPLVRYAGYPLTVTFFNTLLASFRLVGKETTTPKRLLKGVASVHVAGPAGEFDRLDTLDTKTGELLASYDISVGCVPDMPFFVRWINTKGGWDYRMFECREQTNEVNDIANIQRVPAAPNDTQQTISVSAFNTVTVGAGLLGREEYGALAALARSPRIEWYDEQLGTWRVIVLSEDFSTVWNSRNSFGEVEFTFALPRILTQF